MKETQVYAMETNFQHAYQIYKIFRIYSIERVKMCALYYLTGNQNVT